MPLVAKTKVVHLIDTCSAEDAEVLLQWLIEHPRGKVNLKKCQHIHTAVLQVIMVTSANISVAPDDDQLAIFLRAVKSK